MSVYIRQAQADNSNDDETDTSELFLFTIYFSPALSSLVYLPLFHAAMHYSPCLAGVVVLLEEDDDDGYNMKRKG